MSSVRFYLRIFFDLIDIACVNSYLIYNMKHPNKLSLLNYKIIVAKNLVQYHQGWKRAIPMSRPCKRKNQLNRLIIMEDIYQITKRCENDARTVEWRVKKIEHSLSVWLVTFHYAYSLMKLFPKTSHLGVHIMYTPYIFAKTLWFFGWFSYIFTASLDFIYMQFSTYI